MRIRTPLLALVLLPTACAPADEAAASAGASGEGFPVTVPNCGVDVTFDAAPERVALLESAPVTILHGLGVLDRAVLRAGAFPDEYYDAETNAAIAGVESLGEDLDESG